MEQINQLPSFDASFSYLYSSVLGLVDQEQQFVTTEQQPIYQGIPVQVLNPIPIYNCGPDIYQNKTNHSNSLIQYNIESLTNFDSENACGTGIPEIPQSILDEYVPYQPNDESVKNALLLTPSTIFQEQISWDELEIREQTTANHTSSGLQLTNLPAGIHSSKDLRPVAVVNPLCMHQATSDNQTTRAEVNVDDRSSLAERKRERQRVRKREHLRELRKDPAYAARERERERERQRDRYQTDPAYAKRQRERKRERYQTNPAYAERQREHQKERQREHQKERHRERQRERQRELRKDPAYAKRERERKRELRKNSAYAEHERERKRKRYQTDPAYAERERERKRKCYQTDPAYAERQRERQRERKRELRKDPDYAEGQNIYINTYKRIKIKTSNKEEAKKQAVIAREQYLQSVNPAKNSGDVPLTSNLTETPQSSSKNSEGTAPQLFSCQTEGILSVPIELSHPE
ncbi:hypothetical protein [Endozoicomonas sp. GU-1]|uniref:hypothetical protein n=1 Tax=Endozoicomonas sp. GU-1 TaxID=3009078 RepID=UPI0022B2F691|nr:hypothetical protein [Endozoicomonas sp. GU-1]WBA79758.1 hypothetical protein O2T12_15455 [Endozoicomonas sp. GU-1]WBA87341.1 hypothetical protein O3276_04715 [Endozoicomonas sp. GU-1]